MKIVTVTRTHAHDEGDFETREDMAAWLAGAVLAFDSADRIYARIERREGQRDPNAPGSFLYRSQPHWHAEVSVEWPEERTREPGPAPLDVTAVRDALVKAAHALREEP